MNDLTVITVATHDKGYLPVLKSQLKQNGINFKIIGYGDKWKGWKWRTDQILKYLKTHNPTDVIMVIDGYDVIVPGNKGQIMKKYRSFNTDVVFGIEMTDSLEPSYGIDYIYFPIIKSSFDINSQYMMNGGSFMGTAKSLIKIYERIKKYYKNTDTTDDQLALNNISLKDIQYKLDTDAKIFWIWAPTELYDIFHLLQYHYLPKNKNGIKIENNRVKFSNGIRPEVVHGVGQRDMTDLLDPKMNFKHPEWELTQGDLTYITSFMNILSLIILCVIIYYAYNYLYSDSD
jgi:hypothetical protein